MRFLAFGASCAILAGAVQAGDLLYEPVSPSFGGNPLNGNFLLQSADIQNLHDESNEFDRLFQEPSLADEFADAIRNTMVSISAGELLDAVVNREDATGTIYLDGATVGYETRGDRVVVTINDGVTTNVLDLPIPVIP